jgi:hypothetical protein
MVYIPRENAARLVLPIAVPTSNHSSYGRGKQGIGNDAHKEKGNGIVLFILLLTMAAAQVIPPFPVPPTTTTRSPTVTKRPTRIPTTSIPTTNPTHNDINAWSDIITFNCTSATSFDIFAGSGCKRTIAHYDDAIPIIAIKNATSLVTKVTAHCGVTNLMVLMIVKSTPGPDDSFYGFWRMQVHGTRNQVTQYYRLSTTLGGQTMSMLTLCGPYGTVINFMPQTNTAAVINAAKIIIVGLTNSPFLHKQPSNFTITAAEPGFTHAYY